MTDVLERALSSTIQLVMLYTAVGCFLVGWASAFIARTILQPIDDYYERLVWDKWVEETMKAASPACKPRGW